jgi:hypothetical protein
LRPPASRWPRVRAGVRSGNLVLMGALLAYAIAVAASGLLGSIVVRRLDSLTSPIVRVLLGLCVWDAGKALGVALGAVALARLADLAAPPRPAAGRPGLAARVRAAFAGPRGYGVALCGAIYALDLGVAALLGQLRGPWTDPAALLGRGALAVLIGWMAVAIIRRLGTRWHPAAATPAPAPAEPAPKDEPAPPASADPPAGESP